MQPYKSHQLKIKTVSLGLEAELIHAEERRLKKQIARCKAKIVELTHGNSEPGVSNGPRIVECRKTLNFLREQRDSLNWHRRKELRPLTRSAALAYGFLRGKAYKRIEPKRYTDPDWDSILRMILRHGSPAGSPDQLKTAFAAWRKEAGEKAVRS